MSNNDTAAIPVLIDPAKGFVQGNTVVVSSKAARIVEFLRSEGITRAQLLSLVDLFFAE